MISPRTKRRYALVFLLVSGTFIFLIGGASVFLLNESILNILLSVYVIALFTIIYFMLKNIRAYRRFSLDLWRAQAHTPMAAMTNKHCPKCDAALWQTFFAEGGFPQMYVCKKCNYAGPIGLVRERIKAKRKRKIGKMKK